MSRIFDFGTVAAFTIVLLVGCGSQQQTGPAAADHEHNMTEEKTDMNEALADLSPEDRQLAEEQKMCPVSDQALGSMGTPIKVTVDGRDVFVCCKGCVDELKNSPEKYLAKLDATP